MREVLRVVHGGPFEGSFFIYGTDGRQFVSVKLKIYIPRKFQGVGKCPLAPRRRACYIHAFMERSKQYAF